MDNQPNSNNQLTQTTNNSLLQTTSSSSPQTNSNSNTRKYSRPRQPLTLNPFSVIFIFSIIAFIIFALITYYNSQKIPEIKIDNFSKLYPKIPNETKKSAQAMLYNIVNSNNATNYKIPKSGAVIRAGSNTTNYDQTNNFYTDTFLVDLESIQQSYYIKINWSPVQDDTILDDNYPIVILCPTKDQLVYPEFECEDGFESTAEINLFSVLPIEVSYYGNNYSSYTHYFITVRAESEDSDEYIIVINDYTGGNYDAALNKLRETSIDLNQYKLEYNNLTDDKPGRAPGGE